ncbi:MAG: hypothetical protein LUD50_06030, partial [Clostridia bacterium]|nr:hypothetical protein [Clostridia bacterium]
ASRTFAMKVGQAVAMLVFTSVATIGQSVDEVTGEAISTGQGYRITLIISLVCCVAAAIVLLLYNEKKTRKAIQEGQAKLEKEHAAEEAALAAAAAGADGSVMTDATDIMPAADDTDSTSGQDDNTDA